MKGILTAIVLAIGMTGCTQTYQRAAWSDVPFDQARARAEAEAEKHAPDSAARRYSIERREMQAQGWKPK